MRAGQALRGSSEFHAWGDSNLYLRRHGDQLTLSVEHRAPASISTVPLRLDTTGGAVALIAAAASTTLTTGSDDPALADLTVEQRVLEQLEAAAAPVTAKASAT